MINLRCKLLIVTFDDLAILQEIKHRVKDYLGCDVIDTKTSSYPKARTRDHQLNANDFLPALLSLKNKYDFVVGISRRDLYVPRLNFVLGLASPRDSVCVISLARLESPDKALFIDRAVKEVIHEMGHLIGLEHCDNPKCVMKFSNMVLQTDIKSAEFCEKCLQTLQK